MPDWLVFGASIRTLAPWRSAQAGLASLATALSEEGFEDAGSDRLVESFARHLMVAIDACRAPTEFATVTRDYLEHLTVEKGALPALASNGDLLLRWRGQKDPDRHALAAALPPRLGSIPQPEARARETFAHHSASTLPTPSCSSGRQRRGQWAVSGAFAFTHLNVTELAGRARRAFARAFWHRDAWLVDAGEVVEASAAEREAAIERAGPAASSSALAPGSCLRRDRPRRREIDFPRRAQRPPRGHAGGGFAPVGDGAIRRSFAP